MSKAEQNTKKPQSAGTFKICGKLLKDMKPISGMIIISMVLSLLSIAFSMAGPNLLGSITDRVYNLVNEKIPIDRVAFSKEIILLLAVYLCSAGLGALTNFVMNYSVTKHFTCVIRTKMSAKISKIPVKTVDTIPNGEIISRMTNDVSIMSNSVFGIFGGLINGVIKLTVISVVIFTQNPTLAVVIVVFVPISVILSGVLASRSEKYFDQSREQAGKVYSLCEENLTGFDTVKAFSLEQSQNGRYKEMFADYSKKARRGYVVSGIVQPIVTFVNNVAYVAICIIGGYLAIKGKVSAGSLVAFIMYTQLFFSPLETIASEMSMMQSTVASARRVYGFLDGEEMYELPPKRSNAPVLGEVVFEDVDFSYTPDKRLIEGLSITVKAGQKVAIVGPTGGGKTTIVNLLMRFYDPQRGRILVDGEDISKLNRSVVREKFGMVLQDTVLFSGTVYDNIAYGNPSASREEVVKAAEKAHLIEFIESLPNGFDTLINEDSTNISGGQKQLLTIARAYLSDRPILILDEATSSVDTRTELVIQQTMDELMKGRTAFVIAHRLSTIENADVILVVNEGKIVEKGTHGELIKKSGLYYQIHQSQYFSQTE